MLFCAVVATYGFCMAHSENTRGRRFIYQAEVTEITLWVSRKCFRWLDGRIRL